MSLTTEPTESRGTARGPEPPKGTLHISLHHARLSGRHPALRLAALLAALAVVTAAIVVTLVGGSDPATTAPASVARTPASSTNYTGDWKDTVAGAGSAVPERTATSYTGDWKDTVAGAGSAVPERTATSYTGDWKDTVMGAAGESRSAATETSPR